MYWPITPNYESFLKKGGNPSLTTSFLEDKDGESYQSLFGKYAIDVFSENFEFPLYDEELMVEKLKAFSYDFKLNKNPYDLVTEINDRLDPTSNNHIY